MNKKKKAVPVPNLQLVGLRTLRGYASRAAVAKAAGLSQPTCWRIECGDQGVQRESLESYARVLGVDLDELAMLRRPVAQGEMFVAARVVVLPVELWGYVDALSNLEGMTVHAILAKLTMRPTNTRLLGEAGNA